MKLILIAIFPFLFNSKEITKPKSTLIDYNLFKNELNLSISEFANDAHLNKDSVYFIK